MEGGGVLRDVRDDDLALFFEHASAPEACRMAAFPPRSRDAFMSHWRKKVLGDSSVRKRAIVFAEHVIGNILSWDERGRRLVGYWLGPEHWGKGMATAALSEFLREEPVRPLCAYVTVQNLRSIRVLQKCGFRQLGTIEMSPDGVEEYLFQLDG